ncbi:MAG TPA: ATP-binding protein [Bacteroidia bacterium]|nr:ATP-binding protein [Bacteroidia bacterium]
MSELKNSILEIQGIADNDITALILQRVRLISKRRVAWLRNIWTDLTRDNPDEFNSHNEIDGYLSDRDSLQDELEWYNSNPEMQELTYSIHQVENQIASADESRLNTLVTLFKLSKLESDILQLCFAFAAEPGLSRVFSYLHDHSGRGYITETLVTKLFGYPFSITLDPESPLKAWSLIKEIPAQQGEPGSMECDPYIRKWISGKNGIDESLTGFAKFIDAYPPLRNWPVQKVVKSVNRMIGMEAQNKVRVFVEGSEGSGRRTFASLVSKIIGLRALGVDAGRIPENKWIQAYRLIQRQALLSDCAPVWYGEVLAERTFPDSITPFPLQFITGEPDGFPPPIDYFADLHISMPVISFEERLELWKKHVPVSESWSSVELLELALRHETNIGQVISIGKKMIPTVAEAYEALRADSGRRLGKLATQMPGKFTFNDLVVSETVKRGIEDFIFEATDRVCFWEQPNAQRLFPQGRGLIGLFTGTPGTGKTMAAQVIAASLKLDLFRIDLSSVISKYIGDSSKNISQILTRAKNMNVVLLFDEADALFAKRTDIRDSHDRHANSDTNHLLQVIESYPGIVLLASNKKTNIDIGFMRRLRYMLEFPRPDAVQRHLIWKKVMSELAGEDILAGLQKEIFTLAEIIDITGAQIKQSLLTAMFTSRREKSPIQITHIIRGIERELVKEGKGIGKHVYQNFNL